MLARAPLDAIMAQVVIAPNNGIDDVIAACFESIGPVESAPFYFPGRCEPTGPGPFSRIIILGYSLDFRRTICLNWGRH
jgi:hypothetical protein